MTITFADLPLRRETIEALNAHGFTAPFPIQEQVLPIALDNHDVIGQAKTGTGKTLGFGLPIIEHVIAPLDSEWATLEYQGAPQALVVVPTRELCIQVAADLEEIAKNRGIRTLAVYGGRAFEPQIEALENGVEIVVGTPGRLIDLYRQGKLQLKHINRVILDEADIMLDLGFLPDVEKLFSFTPNREQTMLFSATMPGEIISLARRFMNQPMHVRTVDSQDEGTVVDRIQQHVYRAHSMDKVEMLSRILQANGRGPTIVFCRTKRTAQKTTEELLERGFKATTIHGDLGQSAREKSLGDFKSGKKDVLIATDVAARGIDIDGITHVINFQCPEDEKTYVHRIGRTARAGADGIAVTFVDWDDMPKWKAIDQALKLELPEPPETYSSSENLYSDLDIPRDVRGRVVAVKEVKTSQPRGEKPQPRTERPKRDRKRTRSYKE